MPDVQPERNALLFLCVANSARSQMAEALARSMAPEGVEVLSAGSEPDRVNLHAVRALEAIGLDASEQHSKSVNDIDPRQVRVVVTLCAEEVCPVFLIEGEAADQVQRLHWPHEDPAAVRGSDADIAASFAAVRDQIKQRLVAFFSDTGFSDTGLSDAADATGR